VSDRPGTFLEDVGQALGALYELAVGSGGPPTFVWATFNRARATFNGASDERAIAWAVVDALLGAIALCRLFGVPDELIAEATACKSLEYMLRGEHAHAARVRVRELEAALSAEFREQGAS
jgi:hypothetical protein